MCMIRGRPTLWRLCKTHILVWSHLLVPIALGLLGLAGRAWPADFIQAPQPSGGALVPATFRDDRILVKPRSKVDLPAIATFHAKSGTHVLRTFSEIGNLQILQLPPGTDLRDFIAAYRESGIVEYAEPDYFVQ